MSDPISEPDAADPNLVTPPEPAPIGPPLFTILAALAAVACLFTPRITLMLPVMASVGCGATAYVRREAQRTWGLIAGGTAVSLFFLSSYQLSAPTWSNLDAATIVSSNWVPDRSFGGRGAIKWNVEVKNLSDRPIASVKVDIVTRDASGNLIATDGTFVNAILPGGTGSGEGYADFYGNEATASFRISEVRFAQ